MRISTRQKQVSTRQKAAVMCFSSSNFQIIQGHRNSHEKIDLVCRSGFPTNFHGNHEPILYRFQDIGRKL